VQSSSKPQFHTQGMSLIDLMTGTSLMSVTSMKTVFVNDDSDI
jgi:hypothetical protein